MSVELVDVKEDLTTVHRSGNEGVSSFAVLVVLLGLDITGEAVDREACDGTLWCGFNIIAAHA
mgnify:CR=1 FL=1